MGSMWVQVPAAGVKAPVGEGHHGILPVNSESGSLALWPAPYHALAVYQQLCMGEGCLG